MNIRGLVRSCFRQMGLDVRRFHPGASTGAALIASLKAHRVNLVLDVGANTGQFGSHLRELGYLGRIVSFEPLTAAHEQLLEAASGDPLWTVAERMAVGSTEGEIQIHIAGNSVSSSVLPMLDAHSAAAPESVYVGTETVPVHTLDLAARSYLQTGSVSFLKVDTQGYEEQVLHGAAELLKSVQGLQIELSFVPLYEGQRLYDEMISELSALGFEIWGIAPAFVDPRTGRLLQVDATFFRS
jgi:FkbM family methyltransferase